MEFQAITATNAFSQPVDEPEQSKYEADIERRYEDSDERLIDDLDAQGLADLTFSEPDSFRGRTVSGP